MNTSRWAMAAVALVLGGSVLVFADEPKADSANAEATPAGAADAAPAAAGDAAPAAPAGAKRAARAAKLTKPWRHLSSLSDEQRTQIAAIHRKAVQEIKQIEHREREDIMALLNDQQKTEVQTLTDKAAAERKAKKPANAAKKAGDEAAVGGADDEKAG